MHTVAFNFFLANYLFYLLFLLKNEKKKDLGYFLGQCLKIKVTPIAHD